MSRSETASALYAATPSPDMSVLIQPKDWKRDQSKTLVIFVHGAGARATQGSSGGLIYKIMQGVADTLGLPAWSIDAGADGTAARPNNWANSNCLTAIGNAITKGTAAAANYFDPSPGAKAGKVILIGVSMGGAPVLSFASRNPTLVSGVVGIVPAVDMDWIMSNTAGDQDMETAFGGTGSTLTTPGKGTYNAGTTYAIGDVVQNSTGLRMFRSLAAQTGVAPPASGSNAGWSELLYSSAGSFAGTSFNPSKQATPLNSNAMPIQLWWTGNDGSVVPVSGAGVTPPIYSTFQTAVGSSCTLMEITGAPSHNTAADVLGASPTMLNQLLAFVAARA